MRAVPGQYSAPGAADAAAEAAALALAAQDIVLSPEDHAIFASSIYTSPCWILRALLRAACAGEALE